MEKDPKNTKVTDAEKAKNTPVKPVENSESTSAEAGSSSSATQSASSGQTAAPATYVATTKSGRAPRPPKAPSQFSANFRRNISSNKNIILGVCVGAALLFSAASLAITLVGKNITGGITLIGSSTDGNSANFTEGSIADVASKVSPSVVSIVTETRVQSYFGQSSTSSAAGTGMIVSSDGYILTNKHVIDGANTINVITDAGTTYTDVTVVATDPLNDVAFLKVNNVSGLQAVTLGDSKTISTGQQVIAIGNALGQFQNTVTSGIISGTGRSLTASDSTGTSSETLTDMIQTDASINAGNSGGPLVNAAGQVIGINTAVSSDANDIGFAIPISSVKGMLNSLLETGKASRSWIGVYYTMINPTVASAYSLPVDYGAYVYSSTGQYSAVVSGGPAAQAGIQEKDIILSVNGTKVGAAGSVSSLIGEYKPGDTVQLGILRNGQEFTVNVTLGEYTGSTTTSSSSSSSNSGSSSSDYQDLYDYLYNSGF